MKKIFSAVLHELEHEKIKIKKVKKMRKVCPDPPPLLRKFLTFFFWMNPSLTQFTVTHLIQFTHFIDIGYTEISVLYKDVLDLTLTQI